MSTNRSVDGSAATYNYDSSAATPQKHRASLCSFTFTHGRPYRICGFN